MEPIRVLHENVVMDMGGIENLLMNIYRKLLLEPQLLILDEPTKGLDAGFKIEFAEILEQLLKLVDALRRCCDGIIK